MQYLENPELRARLDHQPVDGSSSGIAQIEPARIRLVHEDDAIRITYFDFGPGEAYHWHFHPYDFVVVTLDDGELQSQTIDGATSTIAARRNNFYRVPAGNRHRAVNFGSERLRLLEVELKSTDIRKAADGWPHDGSVYPALRPLATQVEQVAALELVRRDAMLAGDLEKLAELLGDELVYTHSDACRDSRESLLAKLASGALYYRELAIDQPKATCVASDTVLVTGRMRGLGQCDGIADRFDDQFTATWLRLQGFWKLVAFQSTPHQPASARSVR